MSEVKQLDEALLFPKRADALVVDDEHSKAIANDLLLGIKTLMKRVNDTFDPLISNAHATWKAALEQRERFLRPLKKSEDDLKEKLRRYMIAEAQRRLDAERLAKEAAAEAAKKAEDLLVKASEAEQKGDSAEAEKLVDEAVAVETKAIEEKPLIPQKPMLEGAHMKRYLRWRVVDAAKVPREYLCVDEKAVAAAFAQLREKLAIPGIETYWHEDIAVRPPK